MYARVVTYIAHLGKTDEIVHLFREAILPAARQQPGFAGGHLLLRESTGKIIVVSLWETEVAMLGSEATGFLQTQMNRVRPLTASVPLIEHFEVPLSA